MYYPIWFIAWLRRLRLKCSIAKSKLVLFDSATTVATGSTSRERCFLGLLPIARPILIRYLDIWRHLRVAGSG
jgi:hypothetical protein